MRILLVDDEPAVPVRHRVPGLRRVVAGRLRLGELDEVVSPAEALALARERITCTAGLWFASSTHSASSRGVASVNPVAALGPVERDSGDLPVTS
jgi:hypothetical protein